MPGRKSSTSVTATGDPEAKLFSAAISSFVSPALAKKAVFSLGVSFKTDENASTASPQDAAEP
jgi:hypothetical protein